MSGNPSEIGLKSSNKLSLGTCSYDLKTGMLIDPTDKIAELRNQSSKVLARLATTPGEVVTKDDLIAAAWTTPTVSDDSLSQCVRDIRMALGDSGHQILKTIVGRGYCLVPSETKRSVGLPPQVFLENFSFSEGSQTASNLARELYEMLEISLSQRTGIRLVTRRSELEKQSYIISGQARVHNDQIKVFVSLSENSGGGSFFAEHFNADIPDIGPLSDRIVSKISNMQRLQIYTMDGKKFAEQPNSTLTTQELMAKAAYCFAPLTKEGSKEAHLAIQAAVDRSPDNPVALCMLASVTTQMMPLVPEQSSEAVKQWAFSLADRAIAVGPRSEFAFRTRGNLRLWLRHDHAASMDDCERSLELDPDFHLTHLTIATSDLLTGNPAKGAERLAFIIDMVPFHPQLPLFLSLQSLAYILDDKLDQAIAQAKEACERGPNVCWYKMVYVAAAAQDRKITGSTEFCDLLRSVKLDISHFRQMPFSDNSGPDMLEARLLKAGFPSGGTT